MTKFDLDALVREAETDPFVFTFGGEDYELPSQPDIRAVAAMTAGRLDQALTLLLGPDQWERMQSAEAVFDMTSLQALMEAYVAHGGTSLGNSQAPTSSSKSTAAPSKRTSNARTSSV
jgi:hypothetical protein